MNYEKASTALTQNFYNSKAVAEVLHAALSTKSNVILWGKGGYGKSEMTQAYLSAAGVRPFNQFFDEGLSPSKLFGGVDIKALRDHGREEFLCEHSFVNSDVAVFEEMLDANEPTLNLLKDALSSGKVRNGSQEVEIKCSTIVACTNHDYKSLAAERGDSFTAFLSRFAYNLRVEWDTHTAQDYINLFKLAVNPYNSEKMTVLAALCEESHNMGETIVPRTALQAAKTVSCLGFEYLKFQSFFPAVIIQNIEEKIEKSKKTAAELQTLNALQNTMQGYKRQEGNLPEWAKSKKHFIQFKKQLQDIKVSNDNKPLYDSIVKDIADYIEFADEKIIDVTRI